MKLTRLITCTALPVALASVTIAVPSSATAAECSVVNARTQVHFTSVQQAVNSASDGDTLRIKTTCTGATVVPLDLRLVGTLGLGALSGGNSTLPLTVTTDTRVVMKDLGIRDGDSGSGGLLNDGTVVMRGSSYITNNIGQHGGGVDNNGRLVLRQSAVISQNRLYDVGPDDPSPIGGGVLNSGSVVLRDASRIVNNADNGILNGGTVVMRDDALVSSNEWNGVSGQGDLTMRDATQIVDNRAGVNVSGRFRMLGQSLISNNSWGLILSEANARIAGHAMITGNSVISEGAGIHAVGGSLVMAGHATVAGNSGIQGAGIYAAGDVVLTDRATVAGNHARMGAGVYVENIGRLNVREQATITRNVATERAGGIYVRVGGSVSVWGRDAVTDNSPNDCAACF